MDDDRQQAFMTALVTEHFALQGARGQTTAEITGRAALYLATVSSTLIALGFVARDRSAFVPFAAAVIPSLLILGEFIFIRLVAASIEDLEYLYAIQQIRSYYRSLVPAGLRFFADITIGKPRVATTHAVGRRRGDLAGCPVTRNDTEWASSVGRDPCADRPGLRFNQGRTVNPGGQ